MHFVPHLVDLLEQYKVPGSLIALAVVALLLYEAHERGVLDFLESRAPAQQPFASPIPAPDPAPKQSPGDSPLLAVQTLIDSGGEGSVTPSGGFDWLVEQQVRAEARRDVAGSETYRRRLEALIATRDLILANGGTPTPRRTARELLSELYD
jgi:hypothetical protein